MQPNIVHIEFLGNACVCVELLCGRMFMILARLVHKHDGQCYLPCIDNHTFMLLKNMKSLTCINMQLYASMMSTQNS